MLETIMTQTTSSEARAKIEANRYLVGGAVRDQLLGLEPKEHDWVVVGCTVEEMLTAGFDQVGKDFPVFLHPETHDEHALARTERKTAPGYHGFECCADLDVTLEEDLQRRDLTINAMAMDAEDNLIDPYGGKEDLQLGRLRHVSEAFTEDPVRILRVARFAARFGAWNFRVAHDTHQLMKQMVEDGEVDALVPERVWQETVRALADPHPHRFIEVLRACGALARIFPEIDRLFGVPQPPQHHPEVDTGIHTLLVLQQAVKLSEKTTVRFAALLHDLGKGTTPKDLLPKHHGHEARSVRLVKQLCKRLKVPNNHRDLAIAVAQYHTHFHYIEEMKAKTILKMLEGLDAFRRPERFENFLTCGLADQRGRPGYEKKASLQNELLKKIWESVSNINNKEVLLAGFKGKEISEEMRRRRIIAIQNIKNSITHN